MLGSASIWGASFVFIATSLEHFRPGVVTFVRVAIGAITLGLFPGAHAPVDRADMGRVVALAVVWLAFPMTLYPIAQQHISSGLTGMLGASIPIFTAVGAFVAHGQVPARIHTIGIAIGAVGIVMLGLPALRDGGNSVLGVALIAVGCVSYGLAFNLAVPLVMKYGSMPVFWRALVISLPMTIPFAIVGVRHSTFGWRSLAANVTLGAGGTAIAFVLLLTLTGRAGATRSSMVGYLEAMFAFALGTIIRHEPVRVLEVAGCTTLLAGVAFSSRPARQVRQATTSASSTSPKRS